MVDHSTSVSVLLESEWAIELLHINKRNSSRIESCIYVKLGRIKCTSF